MEEKKIIMYDSPEAATYRTNIKGWVSSQGHYWGNGEAGERAARYDGSTHKKCEDCGTVIVAKGSTICDECRFTRRCREYNKLPYKEYDGSPVALPDGGKYFFTESDILDYIEEMEDDGEKIPKQIDLLFCEENYYRPVDIDLWADEAPEDWDGELPKEMQDALDKLNEVISRMPPQSYSPGKIRTSYNPH